jgi:NTE family protein
MLSLVLRKYSMFTDYNRCFSDVSTLLLTIILSTVVISGCASQSTIENVRLNDADYIPPERLLDGLRNTGDVHLVLSFSGGGTRAAAFSYGILEALRDKQLLSEVDAITSVSGGSFTAAYYGLYGEQIFENFEQDFLKQDIQKTLVSSLFNPLNWFKFVGSGFNRTELAINYYDKYIFHGKTFADFKSDMPSIRINATDLSGGQPFIFRQEYFNLLCSDLSTFRVSRAVAASSAVPIAFAPVAIKNYHNCNATQFFEKIINSKRVSNDVRYEQIKNALSRYIKPEQVDYIHLVDGGVADNLGIRALYDTVNIAGGLPKIAERQSIKPSRHLVLLLVNAAVSPEKAMDKQSKEPSILEQLNAVSAAQISRYSVESIQLIKKSIQLWAKQLSKSAGFEVKPYFIQIDFNGVQDTRRNHLLNMVSTSLALPEQQVDELRSVAKHLLTESPEFQRLLNNLSNKTSVNEQ